MRDTFPLEDHVPISQLYLYRSATMNDPVLVGDDGSAIVADYILERYDVICQRGKVCQEHGKVVWLTS